MFLRFVDTSAVENTDFQLSLETMKCHLRSPHVSVCLSVCIALTCESLDLGKSILMRSCIFRISRSCSYIMAMQSISVSQEQKSYLCIMLVGGLPSP